MVRQILAEPLVPGLVDGPERAEPGVFAFAFLDQGDHAQIDSGKVRIGAKMVPDHHETFGFEPRYGAVNFLLPESYTAQSGKDLGHEAGLWFAPAKQVENRSAEILLGMARRSGHKRYSVLKTQEPRPNMSARFARIIAQTLSNGCR